MNHKWLVIAIAASPLIAADMSERKVDPTFLHRYVPAVQAKASDLSTPTCEYKPLFGVGDSAASILKGVVRFGQVSVASKGACKAVEYPAEEQAYVITDGAGTLHYGAETAP